MIQDKGLVMQGDEAASPETFGQTAPHILDENINSSVNVTPVHCRDFQYDESPPELFTQPRNMFDKQNRVYGGLQLYREKQRAALWSEPINDQVTHDNYQNSNCPNVKCDSDQIPFKFNEKRTFAENVNEIHGNIFDNSQDSTFGYVKTGSSDVNLGVRRNTDLGKFVNRPFSGHENHNFICDNNEFARTSNDALFTKETHFSDDLSLSSQEFAAVINKNLIPKNEQTTSATQKNINSSSKWEKYYSQQSEEDLHLDIDALKVKVKDFSVIEKPFKTDNVIFPRNQIDISTQHTNIINNRTNVDKRLFPQLPPVKEDTTVSKVMCTNTATQISRLDNSKLPSSFSSMDSFEQMLANDNLDFSDPELDKLLQTQTNVDKIEGELISESPGSNPNEKFSVANASDMQNDAQWDHKQGEKCSRQKLSPEENEYPNGSCGEIEHQSGSCKEVELDFTPCDKDETNLVENSMAAKPHENIDSMQAVECDTKIADTCDKKTVENCDIKFPDINDRHFEAHNETHAGVKSLSESEISFSLDDSFVTSIQLNVKASTETKKRPAVSLRAPWKENTNSNSVIENVIKSPVSALKRPIANESRIGVGYKEDHQSAIIDTDKMNIESSDNVRLDVVENKPCNMRINFMGYDSEDDDLPSGEEVAIPEKTEVRQNERENAFSENPQNKKSNMFTNSNSSQLKTDTQDKPNPSLSSLKAGTGSVSTPFKNPFKNGEMTQKRTANQGNRVTKRLVLHVYGASDLHFFVPAFNLSYNIFRINIFRI